MAPSGSPVDPDWDTPLAFTLTPRALIHALFYSAETVHTGWDSCVDANLIIHELGVSEPRGTSHCRLVEMEYVEDEDPDITWHDWSVELRQGDIFVVAHWRAQANGNPAEWHWCAAEAEQAFTGLCLLLGQRVRRGLMVETPSEAPISHQTHH